MGGSKDKATPKTWIKLAIIPVLLGVLGIVVWSNQKPKEVDAAPVAPLPSPGPTSLPVASLPSEKAKPKRVAWPKFSHEEILATNPFRGSSAMLAALKPEVEAPASTIASLEAPERPISDSEESPKSDPWAALLAEFPAASKGIFIESSKGSALKVGSRLFQVGDRIGENFRVTAIRPDGIIVESAPAMK